MQMGHWEVLKEQRNLALTHFDGLDVLTLTTDA